MKRLPERRRSASCGVALSLCVASSVLPARDARAGGRSDPSQAVGREWPGTPPESGRRPRTTGLSFAKTPSGGQVVDRSALIMPRSNRSGRRSPCLHGVDPRDNSTASRRIPFPIRSPASRSPLGGTGDTARAAEGHSHQPGRKGRGGSRPRCGGPAPARDPAGIDPSVSPSTVRTIRGTSGRVEPLEDLAGRGGRPRGPRLEAIPPLLRAEGSTAGSSGRGFGEGQDEGDHAGHHRSGRPKVNVDEGDGVNRRRRSSPNCVVSG